MPRKKTHEILEEASLPRALIIGSGETVDILVEKLKEYGCQINKSDKEEELLSLGKFNYIFQFGNFPLMEKFLETNLAASGKYLFIEGETAEDLITHEKIKIIRIGDENLWQSQELAEKILQTIFTGKEGIIIDLRKEHTSHKNIKATVPDLKAVTAKIIKEKINTSLIKDKKLKEADYLVIKRHPLLSGFGLLIGFLAFFLFFSTLSGIFFWYYNSLKNTFTNLQSHLSSSSFEEAAYDIKEAKSKVSVLKKIYRFSDNRINPVRNVAYFKQAGIMLDSSERLLDTSYDLLNYSRQISQKNFALLGGGGSIDKKDLDDISEKISSLKNELISAKTEMEQINLPLFPKKDLDNFFLLSIDKLKAAQDMIPLSEALFLTDSPKVYLILLQNNMELRPTGGFIGSFALATIDKGKIIDFKLEDVYTADGQLKGHVDPPLPIRKYLSQPHFFLRDSNWDPDFAVSAAQAGWFLQKELGITVDGVIGINLYLAQKILQVLGPITLSDFNNEKITADNFFVKAQAYIQKDFFPGSTQKKNFLSSVAREIFGSITFEKNATWFKLLPEARKALEEKNILIYTSDPQINKTLEKLGFSGRMTEVKCLGNFANSIEALAASDVNCLSDYLAVIEANLGVNKANYFVEKSVTIEKKIDENGQIVSLVTLSYENQSTPEISPEATYVNYLRLFVPSESKLQNVTLNNVSIPSSEIDLEKYESDKISYGFLVKIAPAEKGVVRAVFIHPKLLTANVSSYQFYYQKQSGDKTSPLVLSITLPNNLALEPQNFQSTSARENEIFYTTDTSVDRIFTLYRIR